MKKFISIFIAIILLILPSAISASAEDFSSNVSGFSNVEFANGYHGFCIDAALKGAETGDVFTPAASTNVANNNQDGSDVSQKLKILLTQCFEDIFISDGNGGYVVDSLKANTSVQTAIWNITDGRYNYGEGKIFVEKVNAYDGPEIPDEGYTLTLSTGETVCFSFKVVEPPRDDQQSFFCYKVVVTDDIPHEHDHSDDWSSDGKNHWHECDCGDKAVLDVHDATTADCINPSVCSVCNKELAGVDSDNHTGNTVIKNAKPATEFEEGYTGDTYCEDCETLLEEGEVIPATHKHKHSDDWSSDDENHWHECNCGDKADTAKHNFSDGICTVCSKKDASENNNSSIGLDSILDSVPEINIDSITNGIIGIVGSLNSNSNGGNNGSNSGNSNNNENIDTEIPNTGSSSDLAFAYASAAIAMIFIAYLRKKKACID